MQITLTQAQLEQLVSGVIQELGATSCPRCEAEWHPLEFVCDEDIQQFVECFIDMEVDRRIEAQHLLYDLAGSC